jgi:hypothetical protein
MVFRLHTVYVTFYALNVALHIFMFRYSMEFDPIHDDHGGLTPATSPSSFVMALRPYRSFPSCDKGLHMAVTPSLFLCSPVLTPVKA